MYFGGLEVVKALVAMHLFIYKTEELKLYYININK